MRWIVENWSLLVVIACGVAAVYMYTKKFASMPTEQQIAKVKEWLLFAVLQAEKELGSGTGQMKLRYVYDMFLERFPEVAIAMPFEQFDKLVDEVLIQMRHLLETNKDIEAYITDVYDEPFFQED